MGNRLKQLLEKWALNDYTEEEKRELSVLLLSSSVESDITPVLEGLWEKVEDDGQFSEEQQQLVIRNILDRYPGRESDDEKAIVVPRSKGRFLSWHWAVAASVVFIICSAAYFYYQHYIGNKHALIVESVNKVQPGKTGAFLTLSNGSKVLLDTIKEGSVALQGGTVAVVKDGILSYEGAGTEMVYNTISTPKGRQFRLELSDGTNIWLNAESAVRYPVVFKGKERLITITGEVYLEVATNPSQPFRVGVGTQTSIEVLGTSFNINAYEEEHAVRTTLLEGAVRIGAGLSDKQIYKTLSPGQQALTSKETVLLQVTNNVNAASVIAWKEGVFDFNNVPLEEAMRQIARWYDIEVVYQQSVPNIQLGGAIKRSLPFTDLLYFLKSVGLHYKVEGNRKLIIMS